MRARDLGLACGHLPPGERNTIADVPGVTVGHTTLVRGESAPASPPSSPMTATSSWTNPSPPPMS